MFALLLSLAVIPVRAQADDLGALRAALVSAESAAAQMKEQAADSKPDPFSFDATRVPGYVTALVEELAAKKAAATKAELRLEIAWYENQIDETFAKEGLTCQNQVDAAIAVYRRAQPILVRDMSDIHAALVRLRDKLVAEIAAGNGVPGSLWEQIERDYPIYQANQRGSGWGGSLDSAARKRLLVESAATIKAADREFAALAAARSLVQFAPRGREPGELAIYVSFNGTQEPQLQVSAPSYANGAERLEYSAYVVAGLSSGARSGDLLADAFSHCTGNSSEVCSTEAKFVPYRVYECVALAADRRAFAAK